MYSHNSKPETANNIVTLLQTTRLAKINNSDDTKCWQRGGAMRTLIY